MNIEDDLRSLYGAIDVAPESERRVINAVLEPVAAPRHRPAVVSAVLASAAVVVAAVVLVAIRSGQSSNAPALNQPLAAVVPPPKSGTINGAVLDNGRPVARALVVMEAMPYYGATSTDKPSSPLLLPNAVTGADGGYAVRVPPEVFTPDYIVDGVVDVQVHVYVHDGRAAVLDVPVAAPEVGALSAPHQLVFDLTRETVTKDGVSSRVTVTPSVMLVLGKLELVGGPAGTKPLGLAGTVYAYQSRDLTGTMWSAKANSRGEFMMKLPPGTYYFAGSAPTYQVAGASAQPCRSGAVHGTVNVPAKPLVECQRR